MNNFVLEQSPDSFDGGNQLDAETLQECVSDIQLIAKTLVEVETLLYFILGALIFAFFYKIIKSHTNHFV